MNKKDRCILFSFRRCPFAIRARWALISSGIIPEIREINLKEKPIQLTEISSKGTVPVLITNNGEIIEESIDIMEWAVNKNHIANILRNNNKEKEAKIRDIIYTNDHTFKYHLDRFKYSSRYPNENKNFHELKAREILLGYNSNIYINHHNSTEGWLIDNHQSLADWAIWPFVRQYRIANKTSFDNDKELVYLKNWLFYFINHRYFKLVMEKKKQWKSNITNLHS